MSPAMPSRLVKVREIATGRVFETWPVDARELVGLSSKEYEYAPADAVVGVPQEPAPPLPLREQLAEKSYKELQEMAKKAGVSASQSKADLIEALVPPIESGALSLEDAASVLGNPAVSPAS